MSKKPSFFEKLTGASWSDDEEQEKEIKTKKKKKTSSNKKTKNKPMKKTKNKTKTKISPAPKKEEQTPEKNEEWLTESEGQLTIDVYQTPNEIVIKSTIAGVKSEDIDISMNNDMITIKGTREKDEKVSEDDYYYQECYWGPFSRSVILPVDVEPDEAKASMKNGILTIRLPKIEKVRTKKISISSE